MRKEMQGLGGDFWRNAFGRGDRDRDRSRGEERRNQPTVIRGQ